MWYTNLGLLLSILLPIETSHHHSSYCLLQDEEIWFSNQYFYKCMKKLVFSRGIQRVKNVHKQWMQWVTWTNPWRAPECFIGKPASPFVFILACTHTCCHSILLFTFSHTIFVKHKFLNYFFHYRLSKLNIWNGHQPIHRGRV